VKISSKFRHRLQQWSSATLRFNIWLKFSKTWWNKVLEIWKEGDVSLNIFITFIGFLLRRPFRLLILLVRKKSRAYSKSLAAIIIDQEQIGSISSRFRNAHTLSIPAYQLTHSRRMHIRRKSGGGTGTALEPTDTYQTSPSYISIPFMYLYIYIFRIGFCSTPLFSSSHTLMAASIHSGAKKPHYLFSVTRDLSRFTRSIVWYYGIRNVMVYIVHSINL
jgi:hypothetical protein